MEVRLTLQELAEIGSHGFPRVSRHGWKWSHWPAITTIIVMDIAHFSTRVLLMSAEILMKRKNHGSSWGGLRGDFGGFFVFWREYAKTKMGSEGRLWAAHSRRWGRRGDFGFRVFPVIPLLLVALVTVVIFREDHWDRRSLKGSILRTVATLWRIRWEMVWFSMYLV